MNSPTKNYPTKNWCLLFRSVVRDFRIVNTPHFYDSIEHDEGHKNAPTDTHNIQQGKRLSGWIWKIVTRILGIHSPCKWLSHLIYALTVFSALSFTVLGIIFVVYDISSKKTITTAHIGFISLLLGFGRLCLGFYSFRLAGRLFSDGNFAASVRTHSRTLFKINTAIILSLTGFGFLGW